MPTEATQQVDSILGLLVPGSSVAAVIVVVFVFLRHMAETHKNYLASMESTVQQFDKTIEAHRSDFVKILSAQLQSNERTSDRLSDRIDALSNNINDSKH